VPIPPCITYATPSPGGGAYINQQIYLMVGTRRQINHTVRGCVISGNLIRRESGNVAAGNIIVAAAVLRAINHRALTKKFINMVWSTAWATIY
jgi:hypothetical protein